MQSQPSDLFLRSILRGYRTEAENGKIVTPSAIWDHIVILCLRTPGGFPLLFEWDKSKAKNINRIGTIRQCIAEGLVPGLELVRDEKGREIVREVQP